MANIKIITYDFCLTPYNCLSGTTSPMPTLYNSKVYYSIPTSPTTYIWWSSNLNKWVFSETLGTPSNITLNYTGDYPYTSGVKWDGNFVGSEYFKTCDCTCFEKPNYSGNNFLPINECGVITIYPMGISCLPIPPSTINGNGSLSLFISGGTPPYSIRLLNQTGNSTYGSSSNIFNIPNLLPGTYFVEVTDNFGDFQQVINCTIPVPPTTTTTTIPLPPTPSYQESTFCLYIKITQIGVSRTPVTLELFLTFYLYGFTSLNNVITPIYISDTTNEFVYWNYNNNFWYLSANTSSQLVTGPSGLGNQTTNNWSIINSPSPPTPVSNSYVPIGNWSLINPPNQGTSDVINTIGRQPCDTKIPSLYFYINESWWFYYNANIPNQYRGSSCGGGNDTPWFKWNVINLPIGVSVSNFNILCVKTSTSDKYFEVTGINGNQIGVSSTIPWIGTPSIGTTIGGLGLMNSEGWQGPCSPTNYTVTLTANLSNLTTITRTITFIYCNTITNGLCSI